MLQVRALSSSTVKLPKSIKSARPVAAPSWASTKGVSGTLRKGLTYEKRAGKELERLLGVGRSLLVGPWFTYLDENLWLRYCQPDFIYADKYGNIVVVEVKLTWVPEAIIKLRGLYGIVVQQIKCKKPRLMVLVKNLASGCPRPRPLEFVVHTNKLEVLAQWSPNG